ncbi:MAG: hypothetical protein Q9159_005962 [Coniocarpon cinnabarinum]
MQARTPVKINVDLGEGYGNLKCGPDDELIPMIDHANETVRACKEHRILVGAHPGLPDLQGFGRREMRLSPEELTAITRYQVGALRAFLDAEGMQLHHCELITAGRTYGDVKYNSDSTLMIDRKKKAWSNEECREHIYSQVEHSKVKVDGNDIDLPIQGKEVSLCCHSDSPGCLQIVQIAREIVDNFNKQQFASS